MAKINFTEKGIARLMRSPGRYRDTEVRGLLLVVVARKAKPQDNKTPETVASWQLRYEIAGRERWMGLGSESDFSLKQARERARAARQQLADGIDPLAKKQADKAARVLEAAKVLTFEQAAKAYDEQHGKKWRNRKHAAQFLSTLREYAFPLIGKMAVSHIDTTQVIRVLEQKHEKYSDKRLWDAIPETASRLRGRIEQVLGWATVRGYRTGDNPARWKGHLAEVLPAKGAIAKVEHHPALPFADIPEFLTELRQREGVAARALEFLVLTAARTSEVTGALWSEFDLDAKVWTVPAGRMKTSREHRVPLSDGAMKLLHEAYGESDNDHVFIGPRKGGLSNMAMAATLRRMGRDDCTVHGFRSTFRDWCGERTHFPNHVVEMCLAHSVGSKVEAAYRRGDLLDQRRKVVEAWDQYCTSSPVKTGQVIPLREAR